jgi:hypothetical protein
VQTFYGKLLAAINAPIFRDGEWKLCDRSGWPDNQSCQNLVAWSWVKDDDRRLIAVNLSDSAVQARVQVPWQEVRGETWHLIDALSDASYDGDGNEMAASGLYVELQPWSYCFFQYRLAGQGKRTPPRDRRDPIDLVMKSITGLVLGLTHPLRPHDAIPVCLLPRCRER